MPSYVAAFLADKWFEIVTFVLSMLIVPLALYLVEWRARKKRSAERMASLWALSKGNFSDVCFGLSFLENHRSFDPATRSFDLGPISEDLHVLMRTLVPSVETIQKLFEIYSPHLEQHEFNRFMSVLLACDRVQKKTAHLNSLFLHMRDLLGTAERPEQIASPAARRAFLESVYAAGSLLLELAVLPVDAPSADGVEPKKYSNSRDHVVHQIARLAEAIPGAALPSHWAKGTPDRFKVRVGAILMDFGADGLSALRKS